MTFSALSSPVSNVWHHHKAGTFETFETWKFGLDFYVACTKKGFPTRRTVVSRMITVELFQYRGCHFLASGFFVHEIRILIRVFRKLNWRLANLGKFGKTRQMMLLVVSLQHKVLVSVLHFRIVAYCSNWIVTTCSI